MKRIITLLIGIAATIILPANAFAQGEFIVSAAVYDSEGAIFGATVKEANTTSGVTTDSEGRFTLKLSSSDAYIEVSFMGYDSVSYKASEVPPIVILTTDIELLEDVVVVAYGTVSEREMTGSVSAVKADQLGKGIITSPASLLQAKAPA